MTQGALPLDPAKGSSTLWTPFRAIELVTFSYNFRVLIGGTQGALPLDPAKGSSTLWTPIFAIELVAFAYNFRVFIGGTWVSDNLIVLRTSGFAIIAFI